MLSFSIAGPRNLFGELFSAILRLSYPDAQIVFAANSDEAADGLRVSLEGTGRWLFVSGHRGPSRDAAEALANGASSILSLDSQREDFTHALSVLVLGGSAYVPSEVVRWMAGATAVSVDWRGRANGRTLLTVRESEVLALVAKGMSNAEIASSLTISANTVRTHLHALSVKLDATSRTRIVAKALELGLHEAPVRGRNDRRSAEEGVTCSSWYSKTTKTTPTSSRIRSSVIHTTL